MYQEMTAIELRKYAGTRGIRGASRMTKAEIITNLESIDSAVLAKGEARIAMLDEALPDAPTKDFATLGYVAPAGTSPEEPQAKRFLQNLRRSLGIRGVTTATMGVFHPNLVEQARNSTGVAGARAVRDDLQPRRVTIFDPSDGLSDHDLRTRASLNRHDRRHRSVSMRQLDGTVQTVVSTIPKRFRQRGLMRSATSLDLAYGRAQVKGVFAS